MYVLVSLATQPSAGRASALEALVDAAAGILAADSLHGTLGRISHHLRSLLRYDDLTVYEIDDAHAFLRPVFAVGDWVDEILSAQIPLGTGVTGWAVRHRCTRNVPNSQLEPLCDVVSGTPRTPRRSCACRCWPRSGWSARSTSTARARTWRSATRRSSSSSASPRWRRWPTTRRAGARRCTSRSSATG